MATVAELCDSIVASAKRIARTHAEWEGQHLTEDQVGHLQELLDDITGDAEKLQKEYLDHLWAEAGV